MSNTQSRYRADRQGGITTGVVINQIQPWTRKMSCCVRYIRLRAGVNVLLVALMTASCASVGPEKVVSTHTGYNDAVQLTVTREVLMNIVRSRYSDPMQFIAVSSINAQFSVSAEASGSVGGLGAAGAVGQAGGSVGYSDSPTISFAPQSDAAFYKSLYSPFGVEEVIGFGLAYRFARDDPRWQALSLRLSFSGINRADDIAGGRQSELYSRRIDALIRLFQMGASFRQIPEWDFDTSAIAKEKVTAEDKVDAFTQGLYFIEEDNGKNVRLARYRMVVGLTLSTPDDPEVIAALNDLGVTTGRSTYVLRPPTHAVPGVADPHAIWVSTRSMIDVINLATQWVEVPAAHAGIVPQLTALASDSSRMPSLRIRSSKEVPPFPYRVQHRGYWFYVDDTEIESKVFLEVMVAAYSSRVGSKGAQDAQPQLVLPVGGG